MNFFIQTGINKEKTYIIHLGYSGFPIGTATIERIRLIFKGLRNAGCDVIIINKYSLSTDGFLKRIFRYEGIPCLATSLKLKRPDFFILRFLNKLSGILGELIFLIKKRKRIKAAIFYESSFPELLYYRFLSKLLDFKLIVQYVEYRSAIPERQRFFSKINDRLFDAYCFYFCDGIIPISEFLKERACSRNKNLPIIKIPAICDFSEFETRQRRGKNYLMYCGAIIYLQVIEFVIDLYCRLKESNLYNGNLLLVVGGNPKSDFLLYRQLEKKIDSIGYKTSIILKKNIPRKELIALYQDSEILIVPLRNTTQDIARFQHKVGEYTASRKPIVSTNLGEMKFYFKDGVSAILADEYSVDSYFDKLSEALSVKDNLDVIANGGYLVGENNLDYKINGFKLKQFILSLK